jgi:eukaryotic-like serine/threonine-protein kinase
MGKNKKESRKRFQPGPHGGCEALLYEFREPPLLSDDEDDLPPASGQPHPRTVLIAAETFDEALHNVSTLPLARAFQRSQRQMSRCHPHGFRITCRLIMIAITLSGQLYGYFTMEHVAGGSLDRFWRSHGAQFVPVASSIEIIKQVCRGLATAHGQDPPIIHRDIKPQNILVGYQSDGLRAKISDFGLAKKVNPLTLLASARGTRAFKAPEALQDFNKDSCSGDVWAVGMTLYLLLTDKLPFAVPDDYPLSGTKLFQEALVSPSQINPLCDSCLDKILTRSLAIDRETRYRSAAELLGDLESWTPKLRAEAQDRSQTEWSTSKEVLGRPSPVSPQEVRGLVTRAIELAQSPVKLNEAADLMEEAFNKLPDLRSEYQGRVKLWRRGISM